MTDTTPASPSEVPPFPAWDQIAHYAPAADNERYVVTLVVGYHSPDDDGLIVDPLTAAQLALDLTRNEDRHHTVWHVYDRQTGTAHRYEQGDFDRTDLLVWERAASDEPGDQNATSVQRVAPNATSAYYALGPNGTSWSVELIQIYAGEELHTQPLGDHPDEQTARERAQRWETAGC